jgi:hypothetical protein
MYSGHNTPAIHTIPAAQRKEALRVPIAISSYLSLSTFCFMLLSVSVGFFGFGVLSLFYFYAFPACYLISLKSWANVLFYYSLVSFPLHVHFICSLSLFLSDFAEYFLWPCFAAHFAVVVYILNRCIMSRRFYNVTRDRLVRCFWIQCMEAAMWFVFSGCLYGCSVV